MNCIQMKDCQLCLGPHDDEIHEVTLRIHRWFREDIASKIIPWRRFVPAPHSVTANAELPVAVGL
jgi:hypothetical protein